MKLSLVVVVCCWLCTCVWANTESFLVTAPDGIAAGHGQVLPRHISLANKNHVKQTVWAGTTTTSYVELTHFMASETYQVKLCWSAMYPVSLHETAYKIIPAQSPFQDTVSPYPRLIVHFSLANDSYPVLDPHIKVPINVSVVNVKMGIPVDMYQTVLYLALIITITAYLNNKFGFYALIKNF